MFIAALFTIFKRWEQSVKQINEWINKMSYIHRVENNSALKKEILTHATM